MTLDQLKMFQTVLSTFNITKAAQQLFVSPAAVSLQMRNLREELGVDLFVKSGKRLVPTQAALRLGDYTRSLFNLVSEIQEDFHQAIDERPFVLGTGLTFLMYWLGDALRALRRRYPENEIQIITGPSDRISAGVQEQKIDLGIVTLPVQTRRLRLIPLGEEELAVYVSPRVFQRSKSTITARELAKFPFILYSKGNLLRHIVDRFLEDLAVELQVVMELEDPEGIKKLAEGGYGFCFLPERVVPRRTSQLRRLRIKGHVLTRKIAMILPETKHPRRLTESAAKLIQDTLARGGRSHRSVRRQAKTAAQ
ncbi:MAG TPA: LysR family transcriptional regulator [Candidatus Binatia bacterium]|jgi:DNA-binding transcriptional LysR family regulator|nr:LysR family transcriptional regulator [Candidatus Binatia bacterium]